MFEAYVGEDAFRAGVRRYMKNHAYGNTVTDDLWNEIDAVSPRKVAGIAHDFTLQAGVPLITATPTADGDLSLTQSRFALDDSGAAGGSWQVPVIVLSATGQETATAKRVVVPSGAGTVVSGAPRRLGRQRRADRVFPHALSRRGLHGAQRTLCHTFARRPARPDERRRHPRQRRRRADGGLS
ncbi:MAG: M1 family aminopeptidase [Lacunisphaera sp.]